MIKTDNFVKYDIWFMFRGIVLTDVGHAEISIPPSRQSAGQENPRRSRAPRRSAITMTPRSALLSITASLHSPAPGITEPPPGGRRSGVLQQALYIAAQRFGRSRGRMAFSH